MKYIIAALAMVAAFDFEETYDLGFAEVGTEVVVEESSKAGFPWLIVILLLAAAGGAAYYFMM